MCISFFPLRLGLRRSMESHGSISCGSHTSDGNVWCWAGRFFQRLSRSTAPLGVDPESAQNANKSQQCMSCFDDFPEIKKSSFNIIAIIQMISWFTGLETYNYKGNTAAENMVDASSGLAHESSNGSQASQSCCCKYISIMSNRKFYLGLILAMF